MRERSNKKVVKNKSKAVKKVSIQSDLIFDADKYLRLRLPVQIRLLR
jgi:hypothetical protein